MQYAIINRGVVENIAIADEPLADNWIQSDDAGVGWFYLDGVFIPPPQPEVPIITVKKYITVGSFFDRFGEHKYPILASADPMVKALIQDCAVRSYIDLDNPQLPYGLDMLVDAGFAIDINAILTSPITDLERA